jgi:putative tricarboxylic transport membrane protein
MPDTRRSTLAWPETFIGVGLLAFAALVLWQTGNMAVSPLYSKVGPRVFPYLTAFGLAVMALMMIVAGLRGGWQPDDEAEVPVEWRSVLIVLAGLVANVLLIVPLGFTAASTVLFTLVAYGFGSRRPLRDAGIGFAVAVVSYFGFAKALGVNIGAGFFERLLGA